MKKLFILILACSFIYACKQEQPAVKKPSGEELLSNLGATILNPKSLYNHLDTLASDKFLGRKPCSEGEVMTVAYLINALKAMGIQPGNGSQYTQNVPLVDILSKPWPVMEILSDFGKSTLERSKEFVIHSQRKSKEVKLSNSPLIFCGFGVVAPELGWNDYEGVNMKGRTAVVLANDPDFGIEGITQYFRGDTMTYYGRWDYKYAEADRQGADGLLIIHETTSAGYPWFVIQSGWGGSQQALSAVDRSNDCGVKGWISLDAAKKLFDISKKDMAAEIRAARHKGFTPIPLHAKANVEIKNEYTECVSQNVIGLIEGSKYPDEYIVYTAHWDHLGIGQAVENDSIYNGALDNASGIAALLSIAEEFSKPENQPERSVVFLFVTAEEQGLLGTEHYINYPLFPLDKTVCNLNIDELNQAGPMKDFTITGLGYSEMDEIAEKYAKLNGRYIAAEQEPQNGYFFRSDHFYFVREGVPALYAKGTFDHAEKGKEYGDQFREDFVATRYHTPQDEFGNGLWDMRGIMEDADIYYQIGADLANSRDWPQWYKGSGFSRIEPSE